MVIIPKYCQIVFYGKMRNRIGPILCDLRRQRGVELLERRGLPDRIDLCPSIPPKYSVSHIIGFLKGRSAVRIHRGLKGHRRMTGLLLWGTGSRVSTAGLDEGKVRQCIREQDKLESGPGDLNLK